MDIFDEMFSKSPEEKFFETLRHAPLGAVEKCLRAFISEHIAMFELLEQKGVSEDELELYKMENDFLIQERLNDHYIELGAKILGQEG